MRLALDAMRRYAEVSEHLAFSRGEDAEILATVANRYRMVRNRLVAQYENHMLGHRTQVMKVW